MREIDLATWNRAMHCQIFRNSVQSQYCVTFELDITNFFGESENGAIPSHFLLYSLRQSARMRLRNFVAVFGRESRLSMTESTHHLPTLITAVSFLAFTSVITGTL